MEREWRESAQIGWRRGRRGRSIGEGAGAMGLESRAGTLDWSSRDPSPLEDSRCRRPPALSFSLYF